MVREVAAVLMIVVAMSIVALQEPRAQETDEPAVADGSANDDVETFASTIDGF